MKRQRLRTALLAATVLAGVGAGVALAQSGVTQAQMGQGPAPAAAPGGSAVAPVPPPDPNAVGGYDPAQLPAIRGTVAQYDLAPRGEVDGLILQDGTQVHFPPHLGAQVVAAVKPGDAVTVRGLKARALPLVTALSITGDASGQTVVDRGPPGGPGAPPPPPPAAGPAATMQAQGVVKATLYGPLGDANGVLLQNGTIVHVPPPEAMRLADLLKPGATIAAQGYGSATNLGRVVDASAVGATAGQMTPLAAPPPPPGPGVPPPPPFGAPPPPPVGAPPAPVGAPAPG